METFPEKKSVALRRIAVFPIQRVDPDEVVDNALRCPICGTIVNVGSVAPQAEKVVEDVFIRSIDKTEKYEIVPPERVHGVFQRISANSLKAPLKELLMKSGQELGADAVMYGYVYRFRERRGFAYGTDQAASVAFAMHLINARDGSLIWRGIFDKTQLSLMENIFQAFAFYKGKGRWLTAEELTEEGVLEILKTFPNGQ
ncbi:hypothetical protein [Syntrophus aciditrophicus]|uniref:hypothetical protein n=1 Tax=Syntrophus aciditrophicus TaxID=316277 RepID=UPI0011D13226|nr:hypothetical protein [Syntrophus aciditrophicus]